MGTNKKQANKLLLSFLAMLMPLLLNAETVEIDGIWYNIVAKVKQAEVTSNPNGNGKHYGSITIPSTVTYKGVECSVTSIGEDAFRDCSIISIVISNGVTSIGMWAFCECESLTTITFQGTIAQWKTIELSNGWNDEFPSEVVHCTDGDVEI